MKRTKFVVLAFSALAVVLLSQNCQKGFGIASRLSTSLPSLNSPNSSYNALTISQNGTSLKYFGFFADAMTNSYISETSAVANIHFVQGSNVSDVAAKVKLAANANDLAVIMVQPLIFTWQSARLSADYKTTIQQLYQTLLNQQLLGSVLGFYVIDEPYWENVSFNVNDSNQQVYNNLQLAAQELNSVFGNKIIIATEATPTMDKFIAGNPWPGFPPEYNWVAVNCYLAQGPTCDTNEKFINYTSALFSTMTNKPNQNLIFTLDNYWNSDAGKTATIQQQLIQRTQLQYNLAVQYNSPALISFIYQSIPSSSDNLVGLMDMPLLKHEIFDLARSITQKFSNLTPTPTATATPVPTPASTPTPVPTTTPATQNNYRFFKAVNGEHFITLNRTEPPPSTYTYEFIAYVSFVSQLSTNSAQIFRCYSAGLSMHFVSRDPACEGTAQEGSLGFIYATQTTNSTALYRFFNLQTGDHLITTNYSEGINAGYTLEGTLGFVPTN